MIQLTISQATNTESKMKVTITKEIPYVIHKGDNVRVNFDVKGTSRKELDRFPAVIPKGKINSIKYIENSLYKDNSAYFSLAETTTNRRILMCIVTLAENIGIKTEYVYGYDGFKDKDVVRFEETVTLVLYVSGVPVTLFKFEVEELDNLSDRFKDMRGIDFIVNLNFTNTLNLKDATDFSVDIAKGKHVKVRSFKKDNVYAKSIIENLL